MEIQRNSSLNRAFDCNAIENPQTIATIQNPDVALMGSNAAPESYPCTILSTDFDKETSRLTLELETEGSHVEFFFYHWFGQRRSAKGVIFALAPQTFNNSPSCKKQLKVSFDLNDPKYA